MSIAGITQTGIAQSVETANNRIPTKTLTQQDFLKLLVTQLTTQDPLNPMKDTEFVAQMVQFSMLEQNKGMQDAISAMRNSQKMVEANSLLGRSVRVIGNDSSIVGGTVSSIVLDNGEPQLLINGNLYSLDRVITISPEQTNNQNK